MEHSLKAISTVLAAIIIAAFIFTAIVPLIVGVMLSSTYTSSKLAASVIKRALRAAHNINMSIVESNDTATIYLLENNEPSRVPLAVLSVEDRNGNIYIVKPGDCLNITCTIGSLKVLITPEKGSLRARGSILVLDVGSSARVTVVNGRLLEVKTAEGGAARPPHEQHVVSTVSKVAYSLKSIVANFTFTSLYDLFNATSAGVIVSNTTNATKSNTGILWSGVIASQCYVNNTLVKGHFYKAYSANLASIALVNVGPKVGTIIVGGGGGDYTAKPYNATIFMSTYWLEPLNTIEVVDLSQHEGNLTLLKVNIPLLGELKVEVPCLIVEKTVRWTAKPGLIYVNYGNGSYMFCSILNQKYLCSTERPGEWPGRALERYVMKLVSPGYTLYILQEAGRVYATKQFSNLTLLIHKTGNSWEAIGYGLFGGKPAVIVCPYGGLDVDISSNLMTLWLEDCYVFSWNYTKEVTYDIIVLGSVPLLSSKDVLTTVNEEEYYYVGSITVRLPARNYKQFNDTYIARLDALTLTSDNATMRGLNLNRIGYGAAEPFRVKVKGYTYLLSLLKGVPRIERNETTGYEEVLEDNILLGDASSFGIYYYAGRTIYTDRAGVKYSPYYYLTVFFTKPHIDIYAFRGDEGFGGIEPFIVLADTDGNGLSELVFITEDYSFGRASSYDDLWEGARELYGYSIGCLDYTVKPVYVKFVKAGVNGREMGSIAFNVRFRFHDNAADDVYDVENSTKVILGLYLVDGRGRIRSGSEYIYQHLMGLEDTWPPNYNFVTDAAFLPVPMEDDMFYPTLLIEDPYGWSATNDDLDFTLAIEWSAFWYIHR